MIFGSREGILKKPKKEDYKNCKDPEFAYQYAMLIYMRYEQGNEVIKSKK
jgi:hypothetical protein